MSENEEHSVGLSVDWSSQGFSAKIKSRVLSALDRLGAAKVGASSTAVDRQNARGRALTETQVSLIKAASQAVEKQIDHDPKLAAKLLMGLHRAEREAENIGASLDFALQDLRNAPSAGDQSENSADIIDA